MRGLPSEGQGKALTDMTMFSMKPKFDLAEFLAQPAKAGTSRRRGTKFQTPKASPEEEAEDTDAPEPKTP
jgi:hypothetical protein